MLEALEHRRLLAAGYDDAVYPLRINVGGPAVVDELGRHFLADTYVTGGTAIGNAPGVTGTSRFGAPFSLAADVPDGRYLALVQGSELSVAAEGGAAEPLATGRDAVEVVVSDGEINLEFTASLWSATLSAVQIVPLGPPTEALPYTELADVTAREVVELSRLRQLMQATILYANDSNGYLPTNVGELAADGYLSRPEVFVSPRADSPLPRGVLDDADLAAWAESRRDFFYRYDDSAQRLHQLAADDIVFFTHFKRVEGRLGAAFADGHVEILDRLDLATRLSWIPFAPSEAPQFPDLPAPDPKLVGSRANLLELSSALNAYQLDFNRYPTQLSDLWQTVVTDLETFRDPQTSTPLPPAGSTEAQVRAWIDTQADYTYRRPTRFYGDGGPVLWPRHDRVTGGRFIVGDGGAAVFHEARFADEVLAPWTAPRVSATYRPDATDNTVDLYFSEAVGPTLEAEDVIVTNVTTGTAVTGWSLTYDARQHRAMVSLGSLADADYTVTLAAGAVADAAGTVRAEDARTDFFWLGGDVNRDRVVNLFDLFRSRSRIGLTDATFADGDANGDGRINLFDFFAIRSRLGHRV